MILDGGQPLATDHLIEFVLDGARRFRIAQHVHVDPQQRGLDRFHAGREQIAHDLHDLFFCGTGKGRQNAYG